MDDLLQIRVAEREALLQRITHALEADERIVAAWLHGSLGRGDADALSDIDLTIIVADEHSPRVNAERQAYAARIGQLVLVQEAPHNAPPGGAFLLVMYEGLAGPLQVDWNWQPLSQAHLPTDARILFNRAQLAPESVVARPTDQQVADDLTSRTVFFWMMVQIAAKKIARHQLWAALIVINYLQHTLSQTQWLVGQTHSPPFPENRRLDQPPNTRPTMLALVRSLTAEMEALTPLILHLGGQAPTEVIQPTYQFLDIADALIAARPVSTSHR